MNKKLSVFNFDGDEIYVCKLKEKLYVAISIVCEHLGLSVYSQTRKIKSHTTLKKGYLSSVFIHTCGIKEIELLELSFFQIWIATITKKNIEPIYEAKLEKYQLKCKDAIYDYYTNKRPHYNKYNLKYDLYENFIWKKVIDKENLKIKNLPNIEKKHEFKEVLKNVSSQISNLTGMNIENAEKLILEMFEPMDKPCWFCEFSPSKKLLQIGKALDNISDNKDIYNILIPIIKQVNMIA